MLVLDIFVSDTNIARKLHLLRLNKKHFSYIRTHTPFLDQIFVFVLLKIKGSGPYHIIEIKKISLLINDLETNTAYEKNPSKERLSLLAIAIRFIL